jgi:polyhydroxybutyrate depolymerase
MHDGLQREYILYVPSSYTGDEPAPLVFNFHGYGSNATDQMWYGDFRPIADRRGFLIVHPQGTLFEGVTHWNVGGWTAGSTVDDVGFTEALIDFLSSEYNIDSARVYSTGMSNGGYMSFLLACQLSERFAAIASVTGSMTPETFNDCSPQHPTPIMQIHGTSDGSVPYGGNVWSKSIDDVIQYWVDSNHCNPTPTVTALPDTDPTDGSTVEHIVYYDGDRDVNVEHFKVIGGGHTWPGNPFGGGSTNYDIDASEEIWRFFSRYDINGFTDLARLLAGPGPHPDNPPLVRLFPPESMAACEYGFPAYGASSYGVNVSCGDVDGDLRDEILTGAGPGVIYGPHVRGFNYNGGSATPLAGLNFLAYGTSKYGVNVAAGDLDGEGHDEIVTGAGPGAVFGPHVRGWIYNGSSGVTPCPGVSYFAYGTSKWGVNVTGGDIDGDGFHEIVTGAGPGAVFGPHVRGWNVDGGTAAPNPEVSYFAYGSKKFGVRAACGDADGDGFAEIVTAPGPSVFFGAHLRGWNYDNDALTTLAGFSFFAWPSAEARYGARIFAGADLNINNRDEIIAGAGPDPSVGSPVRVFRYSGSQVTSWFSLQAYPSGWTHGATVAAGSF